MKIEVTLDVYNYTNTDGGLCWTIWQGSVPEKPGYVKKRYLLTVEIPDEDLGIDGNVVGEIKEEAR